MRLAINARFSGKSWNDMRNTLRAFASLASGRACRPKDAIVAFITEIIEHSLNDKDRRGCLLVNSALEIAPHDPEIGAEVASRLGDVEASFRRSVIAAQKQGASR